MVGDIWGTCVTESGASVSAQAHIDTSVHSWYRLRLGYSDHFVSSVIKDFDLDPRRAVVLDPFCGAGTTIVECKKQGISSIGIDANPSSCFATRVKTHWAIEAQRISALLPELKRRFENLRSDASEFENDNTVRYLKSTGMIDRGWICDQPLAEAIAIKRAIAKLKAGRGYAEFLMLALVSEVVEDASNVKFGPELYCGPRRKNADVFAGFHRRAERMIEDIKLFRSRRGTRSRILQGDSRKLSSCLHSQNSVTSVICSPPYPAEHDYTRNSRLELAFLEQVGGLDELRAIKKRMVRCHTKGIYKSDSDGERVAGNRRISAIANAIDRRAAEQTSGFSRYYAPVVREYFGGMLRHFESLIPLLKPGSKCAYVVGDQSSYLQVHIPTASILSQLAEQAGLECIDIRLWRERYVSTTKRTLKENVLILKKPMRRRVVATRA